MIRVGDIIHTADAAFDRSTYEVAPTTHRYRNGYTRIGYTAPRLVSYHTKTMAVYYKIEYKTKNQRCTGNVEGLVGG